MQADLIFSGVPKGEDYWGPIEDQYYFSTFYTVNKDQGNRFLVEVRKSGNKAYSYYNYLLSNTIDNENRSGGYFCMSLRLEMFCKDVVKLYHFMDMIFNKYVLNNVLVLSSNSFRYQIAKFEQKKNDILSCQNGLLELIQSYMTGNDFLAIDDSFNQTKLNVPEFNFSDCTKEFVLDAVKRYAAITCSTTALLQREYNAQQTFKTRLASATEAKDQELVKTKNDLQDSKDKCVKLQKEIDQLNRDIENKNKDIKQKELEIKQNALRQNVSQIVSQIKEPINKLASITGQIDSEESQGSKKERKSQNSVLEKIIKLVLPVLNFLVLLGIGYYLYSGFDSKSDNNNSSSLLSKLSSDVATLVNRLDSQKTAKQLSIGDEPSETTIDNQVNTVMTKEEDFSHVRINIVEYSGNGPLSLGHTYHVRVIDAPKEGKWVVDNLKIELDFPTELTVVANNSGEVKISYYIDGKEVKSRVLMVN